MLRNITLRNFKTAWGERVYGPFEDDCKINAITGPNGVGKSNVFDGICFVLGTERSLLRAKNLHSFRSRYPPGKVDDGKDCEVELQFYLPKEGSTVTLARSVPPTGNRTVFKMDGQLVTKDVFEQKIQSMGINPIANNFVIRHEEIIRLAAVKDRNRLGLFLELSGCLDEYWEWKNAKDGVDALKKAMVGLEKERASATLSFNGNLEKMEAAKAIEDYLEEKDRFLVDSTILQLLIAHRDVARKKDLMLGALVARDQYDIGPLNKKREDAAVAKVELDVLKKQADEKMSETTQLLKEIEKLENERRDVQDQAEPFRATLKAYELALEKAVKKKESLKTAYDETMSRMESFRHVFSFPESGDQMGVVFSKLMSLSREKKVELMDLRMQVGALLHDLMETEGQTVIDELSKAKTELAPLELELLEAENEAEEIDETDDVPVPEDLKVLQELIEKASSKEEDLKKDMMTKQKALDEIVYQLAEVAKERKAMLMNDLAQAQKEYETKVETTADKCLKLLMKNMGDKVLGRLGDLLEFHGDERLRPVVTALLYDKRHAVVVRDKKSIRAACHLMRDNKISGTMLCSADGKPLDGPDGPGTKVSELVRAKEDLEVKVSDAELRKIISCFAGNMVLHPKEDARSEDLRALWKTFPRGERPLVANRTGDWITGDGTMTRGVSLTKPYSEVFRPSVCKTLPPDEQELEMELEPELEPSAKSCLETLKERGKELLNAKEEATVELESLKIKLEEAAGVTMFLKTAAMRDDGEVETNESVQEAVNSFVALDQKQRAVNAVNAATAKVATAKLAFDTFVDKLKKTEESVMGKFFDDVGFGDWSELSLVHVKDDIDFPMPSPSFSVEEKWDMCVDVSDVKQKLPETIRSLRTADHEEIAARANVDLETNKLSKFLVKEQELDKKIEDLRAEVQKADETAKELQDKIKKDTGRIAALEKQARALEKKQQKVVRNMEDTYGDWERATKVIDKLVAKIANSHLKFPFLDVPVEEPMDVDGEHDLSVDFEMMDLGGAQAQAVPKKPERRSARLIEKNEGRPQPAPADQKIRSARAKKLLFDFKCLTRYDRAENPQDWPIEKLEKAEKKIEKLKAESKENLKKKFPHYAYIAEKKGEVMWATLATWSEEYEKSTKKLEKVEEKYSAQLKKIQDLETKRDNSLEILSVHFNWYLAEMNAKLAEIYSSFYAGRHGARLVVHTSGGRPFHDDAAILKLFVRVPGSVCRNFGQLSGGERNLAMLALFFSFHSIRKAPFVLLDEVDKNLDRRGQFYFSLYLRKFSEDCRVFMISHREIVLGVCDIYHFAFMNMGKHLEWFALDLRRYDIDGPAKRPVQNGQNMDMEGNGGQNGNASAEDMEVDGNGGQSGNVGN